ncbi:MAG: hypothetical protein HQK49_03985 [Oligoflexia bacterium]|nr:hypothetical protein [Oligoflexia bacterium]
MPLSGLKIKTLILFIAFYANVVSLTATAAAAAVAESISCNTSDNVDFSSELGPVRDQGREGLCWSYAANTLMRQKICKEKGNCSDPNFQLSIIDGMACAPSKQKNILKVGAASDGGGRPEAAMACMLDKGVCSEKEASMEKYKKISSDKNEANKLKQCIDSNREDCNIVEANADKKVISDKSANATKDLSTFIGELIDVATATAPHGNSFSEDANLKNFPAEAKCVYNMVVSNQCKANRFKPANAEGTQVKIHRFNNKKGVASASADANESRNEVLKRLVKRNEASVLAVCLDRVQLPEMQALYGERSDGASAGASAHVVDENKKCKNGHAVVLGGMKCVAGKLYYYIQNSWGKDSPFHGWVAADAFVNAVMDATYLSSNK